MGYQYRPSRGLTQGRIFSFLPEGGRFVHTESMRYWWANQKQTYEAEVAGGYLWCRQRRSDGSRNPFYDAVRLTRPGDVIFGYSEALIKAVGLVMSVAREAPEPPPAPGARGRVAGATSGSPDPRGLTPALLKRGAAKATPGWLIDVAWLQLKRPLHPAPCMAILAPLLPEVYAPLTPQGRGLQGGRLLELPVAFARALLQLTGGTDPAKLVNPDWHPHQLRFAFDMPPPAP